MQSINKIHVNSSTEMSLNDRFTIMQHTSDNGRPVAVRKVRNRSGSASRSRVLPRTTLRNKNLSQLLDLNQKIQAALRLKRRSVRRNVSSTQTLSNRMRGRNAMKRAINAIHVGPSGRLRRANSLTNVRTMRADMVGLGLTRSNSSTNLAARLGNRQAAGNGGGGIRRKLNRSNLSTQRRSASRQRSVSRLNSQNPLRRSNSQVNLRRSNSQVNLRRSNSRQNFRNGPAQNQNIRSRSRSRTNRQNNQNNVPNAPNRRMINRRSNSQIRNTVRGGGGAGNRIIRGRVFKRNRPIGGANQPGGQNMRANQIRGRSRSRGGHIRNGTTNRSVSRGRLNRQGNNNKNNPQNRSRRPNNNNTAVQRRSRSRQRKGPTSAPTKTKEELDKELDQYMVNTKPQSEMDTLLGNL